jgi:hypothetical protein
MQHLSLAYSQHVLQSIPQEDNLLLKQRHKPQPQNNADRLMRAGPQAGTPVRLLSLPGVTVGDPVLVTVFPSFVFPVSPQETLLSPRFRALPHRLAHLIAREHLCDIMRDGWSCCTRSVQSPKQVRKCGTMPSNRIDGWSCWGAVVHTVTPGRFEARPPTNKTCRLLSVSALHRQPSPYKTTLKPCNCSHAHANPTQKCQY